MAFRRVVIAEESSTKLVSATSDSFWILVQIEVIILASFFAKSKMRMLTPSTSVSSVSEQWDALANAFPKRPMLLSYSRASTYNVVLGAIFGLLGVIFIGYFVQLYALGLVRDVQMMGADNTRVEPIANLSWKCTTTKYIFVDCEVDITYRPDPARFELAAVKQEFFFVGMVFRKDPVVVLRSKADPRMVTTNSAINHLLSRSITFLVIVGLSIWGLWKMIQGVRQWIQQTKLHGRAMVFQPIIATIVKVHGQTLQFEASVDGQTLSGSTGANAHFSPLQLPLNPALLLAVRIPHTTQLISIDENLTQFDFTDSERQQIRAALQGT